jgi:basic membrane lipoprotein Med (substrate-binding protein (PBP1-ABC) superfamily)
VSVAGIYYLLLQVFIKNPGMKAPKKYFFLIHAITIVLLASGCLHYSMKESSIGKDIKTIRIGFIENKARYINPQLSPQLTERLRQKVNSQTSKTLIQGDNADMDISGYISDYSFTTAAIAGNRSATNRLNITVHIKLINRVNEKDSKDQDVTRSFDFDANVSIQQAEQQLNETILKNLSDEIFNSLFSNW